MASAWVSVSLIPADLGASPYLLVYNNSIMTTHNSLQKLGIKPVNMKWFVVRGDSASLKVEFLEQDEVTPIDMTNWQFEATAFNSKDQVFDDLEVRVNDDHVVIVANSDLTEFWGSGVKTTVAELSFDLQVSIDAFTVWTAIVGTIHVIGDVTGGRL